MTAREALDVTALARWKKREPIAFIEHVMRDPESGKPFVLSDAERAFLTLAFTVGDDGRLKFPEQVFGAIKKSGKTTLAAITMLVVILLLGSSRYAEGYCVANDLEQAQSRVFAIIKRIIECSPMLRAIAKVTADRVSFPVLDASIVALASDAASAAGANPCITCFDELWGYTSERSQRLFDEMITSPARKISCRLTVSYAGFTGESTLLEQLYKRGMTLPEVGPRLHAGDGMLFAWHCEPTQPWQTEAWLSEMRRSLRPTAYARMIENQFVGPESKFVDLSQWDACILPSLTPVMEDKGLQVWAAVDASTKRDSTALVATTYDKKSKTVRLIAHNIFTPTPNHPLDFEATVEATLLQWRERFMLRKVLCDPYQMASVMQRMVRAGVKIEEYPQTLGNLTDATSNLFDLIQARQLVLYPDQQMRLAVSRAIVSESSRGWKIDKLKQHHHIDVVVALSMACLAAVRGQDSHLALYTSYDWVMGNPLDPPAAAEREGAEALAAARTAAHAAGREDRTRTVDLSVAPSVGPPPTQWRSPYWN